MSKKTKLLILVFLIISLGFLRDYFFMNINWIYLNLTVGRPNQALNEFHFLLNWSVASIEILKWCLTVGFTLLFFGLTYIIIRISFNNKLFNQITIGTFAALFSVAGVFYFIGYFSQSLGTLYGIVRTLMGLAQSFMPLMILYVLFKFLPVKESNHS